MTVAQTKDAKPIFTQEQRSALRCVYSFLIEHRRKRLGRLNGGADLNTQIKDRDVIHREAGSAKCETKLFT